MVDDLFIDGEAVNDVSNAIGADGLDILWIQGASVFDGFVITGQTTMAWGATKPTQSKLAFQIKVGKLKPTATEPTSWGQVKALYR
jgi:hypothetical protein